MKIGYDAKRIFHNTTGLGNYGRDVVRILGSDPALEHFFLFNPKKSKLNRAVDLSRATIVYPEGWFWKRFTPIWRSLGQWHQAKKLKLDYYHGLSGELPIVLRPNTIKKIVTIHDLIFLSHPKYYNFWDRIIYRFKFKYAVTVADHVVAISEQTKKDIEHYFKVDPHKISVIYQGCHQAFKQIFSKEEKERVKRKFNLPDRYVLNVGTLQDRKNALTLIQSVQGTDIHVVLVGKDKNYAKKLYSFVQQNQMAQQVTFIKQIEMNELAAVYQAATIFCYPSICEGFGIPIIEAMYSKIPVVVSRGGCFPEAAGPDAVYVDPLDSEDIKKKIQWLMEHPEMRDSIAQKGYTYVQRFSDENVAKNLMNLYTHQLK